MAKDQLEVFRGASAFAARAAHFLAYLQAWTSADNPVLKALVASETGDIMREWTGHSETLLSYYPQLDRIAESRINCAGDWSSNAHKAGMLVATRALSVIARRLVLCGAIDPQSVSVDDLPLICFNPLLIVQHWDSAREAAAEFPAFDHTDTVSRIFRERAVILERLTQPAEQGSLGGSYNMLTPADSKADSPKKLPKSDRVLRAIHAVNDYYKRVSQGKANNIPENAILSMHLDEPIESDEVKNLARQLRNYRHLIRKLADS